MVGMSPLERMFYFEVLKLTPGFVSQWYDPMSRLFNAVFLPAVVWIIFLHFALRPFKKFGKGLWGLLAVGVTVFGIANGFYAMWAEFAQTWFFLLVLISAFLFIMETFVSRKAMYNILDTTSKGLGGSVGFSYKQATRSYTSNLSSVKMYDSQMEAISKQIDSITAQINNLTITMATVQDQNSRAGIQRQITQLQNQLSVLQKKYMKLSEDRAKALQKLTKAEGKMKQIETLHSDRFS